MRRREFITLLGGAASAWPLAARAQQGERVRRIGVLQTQAVDDAERQAYLAAFRQELERLGWADGRNIQIDYRWSAGNAADTRKYATELVALAPDLIFTIRLRIHAGLAASDPQRADCVRFGCRSGRGRLCQ